MESRIENALSEDKSFHFPRKLTFVFVFICEFFCECYDMNMLVNFKWTVEGEVGILLGLR